MKRVLVLLCLVLICDSVLSQEGFSSVEERMTGQEFTAAGLAKLTPEELAALNRWLRDHSVATLDTPVARGSVASATGLDAVADKRGFEGAETNTDTIVSPLVGEFTGWDGDTVFELENGMVWKQDETDRYFTRTLVNPVVTIKSGLFNSWRLSVEGYYQWVKVKRLQ
jgi:hypothetical protein